MNENEEGKERGREATAEARRVTAAFRTGAGGLYSGPEPPHFNLGFSFPPSGKC